MTSTSRTYNADVPDDDPRIGGHIHDAAGGGQTTCGLEIAPSMQTTLPWIGERPTCPVCARKRLEKTSPEGE